MKYGDIIRIRHVATGALLSALEQRYSHEGTSKQHIVGGTAKKDESTLWLLKPPDSQKHLNLDGREITDGGALRLEHKQSRRNLHSHDKPAPLTGPGQYEVTAYSNPAVPGDGNVQDDWVLSLTRPGEWHFGESFRLKHVNAAGRALHSHGIAEPDRTGGLFEVTAVAHGDGNDLFCAEATDSHLSTAYLAPQATAGANKFGGVLNWKAAAGLVAATAGVTWLFIERAQINPLRQQLELVKEQRDAMRNAGLLPMPSGKTEVVPLGKEAPAVAGKSASK